MRSIGIAILLAVTASAPVLFPQEIRDWRPDEEQIRRAMHEEILERIAKKHVPGSGGQASLFDYHTNQAYEKIKSHLRAWSEKDGALIPYLQKLYDNAASDPRLKAFRETVDGFAYGWGMELRDTLQQEYDECYFMLMSLIKLNRDLARRRSISRAELQAALDDYNLPHKLLDKLDDPPDKEPILPATAPTLALLGALKKCMAVSPPDPNQSIMFALGDRYRDRYNFMQDFLRQFHYLFVEFTGIWAQTRSLMQRGDQP